MRQELPGHLWRWVRQPGPAALLARARRRAERGLDTESGFIHGAWSAEERKQIGRLLGRDWDLSGRAVRLQTLSSRLSSFGLTVRDVLEAATGPIVTTRERRQTIEEARNEARREVLALLLGQGLAEGVATAWIDESALPAVGPGEMVAFSRQVIDVWRALPSEDDEPIRLAQLAAIVSNGDAHWLDYSSPRGRAVARLAAQVHGLPRPTSPGPAWRRAWAAVRVLCDEVSSRVLCLNVALTGGAPAVRILRAAQGEPVWLTMRSMAGDWTAEGPGRVFVCENPTIIEAAADAMGHACPPLVCTDGIPTAAVLQLLGGLRIAGCDLWVRADFDAAGLLIVETVRSHVGSIVPWRFDAATYERVSGCPLPCGLGGSVPADVHEEAMLEVLLGDLRQAGAQSP